MEGIFYHPLSLEEGRDLGPTVESGWPAAGRQQGRKEWQFSEGRRLKQGGIAVVERIEWESF